ncbi:MAG: Ldh family oxidoreductase [Betaproteobacteria bacterium]|nr:Ldh family oxidoreductase [Betaproteobacteria bacterium]
MEIASASGIAVVGACNTWFSGRLAYYVERIARAGFVAMHTANTAARVAPFGGADRILGTNPIAFAFPCGGEPVVLDIGTSGVTWGEALLRQATGRQLDSGVAVDAEGCETTDPAAALAGAFLTWGGARGSSLAFAAQLFGILAGSDPVLREARNSGFFFLALNPDLLMPAERSRRVSRACGRSCGVRDPPRGRWKSACRAIGRSRRDATTATATSWLMRPYTAGCSNWRAPRDRGGTKKGTPVVPSGRTLPRTQLTAPTPVPGQRAVFPAGAARTLAANASSKIAPDASACR